MVDSKRMGIFGKSGDKSTLGKWAPPTPKKPTTSRKNDCWDWCILHNAHL